VDGIGPAYRQVVARVPRSHLPPAAIFHVTTRGVGRMAILREDIDGRSFTGFLVRSSSRFEWQVHAYCLMTNHFHLVVEAATERLSQGMQSLNWSFARRFNDRYDRTGHVFEGRFRTRLIEGDAYLERACTYVWNNPVAVGLAATPDDWPWSGRLECDSLGD
jgi:REP element-mobilizing transposase RayT